VLTPVVRMVLTLVLSFLSSDPMSYTICDHCCLWSYNVMEGWKCVHYYSHHYANK